MLFQRLSFFVFPINTTNHNDITVQLLIGTPITFLVLPFRSVNETACTSTESLIKTPEAFLLHGSKTVELATHLHYIRSAESKRHLKSFSGNISSEQWLALSSLAVPMLTCPCYWSHWKLNHASFAWSVLPVYCSGQWNTPCPTTITWSLTFGIISKC